MRKKLVKRSLFLLLVFCSACAASSPDFFLRSWDTAPILLLGLFFGLLAIVQLFRKQWLWCDVCGKDTIHIVENRGKWYRCTICGTIKSYP